MCFEIQHSIHAFTHSIFKNIYIYVAVLILVVALGLLLWLRASRALGLTCPGHVACEILIPVSPALQGGFFFFIYDHFCIFPLCLIFKTIVIFWLHWVFFEVHVGSHFGGFSCGAWTVGAGFRSCGVGALELGLSSCGTGS